MDRPAETIPPAIVTTEAKSAQMALWMTYVNIVLYALCFQLQRPIEPYLVQELSRQQQEKEVTEAAAQNTVRQTYGALQSFFSLIQTLGSPLVGILLDRMGIQKASAMVFGSSALSYAMLARATDMTWLFLSKLPTALQHAFLVAQATAATSCSGDEAARAQALGRMTTAYTLGATLGPALGGWLAGHGDFYLGAKLAVAGSLLSVLLSLMYLPNVVQPVRDAAKSATSSTTASSSNNTLTRHRSFLDELRRSGELLSRSALWPLLVVKVVGGVTASMQSTVWPLILTQDLRLSPKALGATFSANMAAVAVVGAVGLAPLTRRYGAAGLTQAGLLIRAGLGILMAALVGVAYQQLRQAASTPDANGLEGGLWTPIMALNIFQGLASHALATGLTTQTTGAVTTQEQGALLGLEHGLFSLARIVGPPLGTALLSWGSSSSSSSSSWGFGLVAVTCSAVDVLLVALLILTATTRASKRD